MMILAQPYPKACLPSAFLITPKPEMTSPSTWQPSPLSMMVPQSRNRRRKVKCGSSNNGGERENKSERRSFLTLEEAGLVEISGLSSHERFLCRLTISSLNLLRVISEQEGCSIEELNAGRVCDWFLKDKLKREQNSESAVLQWDDSEFQF